MEQKHYKNPKLAHFKALQTYLGMVQEIPEVVEVRLGDQNELHTIISGPWDDDDVCEQVSDAEDAVLHSVKNQPFLFLVVNTQRIPQDDIEAQLQSFGELVWKR